MRALLVPALLLATACGERPDDPAVTLLHEMQDTLPADGLSPSQREAFERCAYVYDTEEGLRECLVLRERWAPEVAAKAIAYREARIRATVDSFIAATKAEQARRRTEAAAARKAEERRRDSVYRATHREWLDGPEVEPGPEAKRYMLDTRTRAHYLSDCEAARRIPVGVRRFYGYQQDLPPKAWPSEQPGCAAGGG